MPLPAFDPVCRQRGQAVDGGMGVVVQEMVEAEAAGVLFSLDPVTGSPANITITANYGLGEVGRPRTMARASYGSLVALF